MISSLSGNDALPGEIVTTFKPPGGADEGAIWVGCSALESDDGAVTAGLAGPLPDAGPSGFDGQLPLEPTGRVGRGGTLGIGLF